MQQAIAVDALPMVKGAEVAVLRSKWYADIVESMYSACVDILTAKGAHYFDIVLPGCFEFPFAADELCRVTPWQPDYVLGRGIHAIICLGVVLKGETYHFEMILNECVRGLGEVSRRHRVPIINEILPVTDLAQARERAGDDPFNKGIEAAAAAIEIIHWRRSLG